MLDEADVDHDGSISFSEFVSVMEKANASTRLNSLWGSVAHDSLRSEWWTAL